MFDDSADGGWQRDQNDFVTLALHAQDAVTVLLAEVVNVTAGGLEDPETKEAEHRDQGEVTVVAGRLRGGQHRFELQMAQT